MKPTLQFDELHVISDLHLGGVKPFQIFGSTRELVALVEYLTKITVERQVGLLINGDFIDFLAEEPSAYFDPDGAVSKLNRILKDATFELIVDALSKFVRTKNRMLMINLGNHDLELALPWVREHLIQSLCGEDLEARGRLNIVLDGTGVLCQVGNALVLCLHGNEVDSWNVADFETIRRVGRDAQFGWPVEAWVPNAGTRMVIDVMNTIKRRFPFVDLLKPEAEAVVPTLLALDPSALPTLRDVASVAGRRAWDAARMATGFLGDPIANTNGVISRAVEPPAAIMAGGAGRFSERGGRVRADDELLSLMEVVEIEARKGTVPMDLIKQDQDRQLGFWGATWKLISGKPMPEVLREALEDLDKDRSFDIEEPDDTFKRLDALVTSNIDYVVAGHTHLERALRRKSGRAYYFNSGTWARLIKIKKATRQDPVKFERVFNLLKGGSMEDLDKEPDLVIKRCSIVSVWTDPDGRTYGELRRMGAGQDQPQPVEDSRYPRS
ncbi:MAG: metallophosphoesterase [Nitrospira sp.]